MVRCKAFRDFACTCLFCLHVQYLILTTFLLPLVNYFLQPRATVLRRKRHRGKRGQVYTNCMFRTSMHKPLDALGTTIAGFCNTSAVPTHDRTEAEKIEIESFLSSRLDEMKIN